MSITQEEVRPLREAIRSRLLPAVTSRDGFSEDEILLLELPARLASLGIQDVGSVAERECEASRKVTDSQVRALVAQSVFAATGTDLCTSHVSDEGSETRVYLSLGFRRVPRRSVRLPHRFVMGLLESGGEAPKSVGNTKRRLLRNWLIERIMVQERGRGASSWLWTGLPLKKNGLGYLSVISSMHCLSCMIGLCMAHPGPVYDWPVYGVPLTCVCCEDFTTDQVKVCLGVGLPSIRQHDTHDLWGGGGGECWRRLAMEWRLNLQSCP